jgi:hypothetical protein
MAAQISDHDALVEQLRAHIPGTQGIADRAYAAAHASLNTGTQREMERVGNKATDLVIALGALKSD